MAKKDKKVKKNKAPKVDKKESNVKTAKVETKAVRNLFTDAGLGEKHRSMFFQESRFQLEVPSLKNRSQFPYACIATPRGEQVALLVLKGKAVGFYSRTGAPLQNLETLMGLAELVKGDGVYMGTLFVTPDVMDAKKFAALVSPFRKAVLTAPQKIAVEADAKFLVTDFVTFEEFSAGTALLKQGDRLTRIAKNCKKLNKKQGVRFPQGKATIVDSQAELDALAGELDMVYFSGLSIRGNNPWVAGHKNFHYMIVVPPTVGKFEFTGIAVKGEKVSFGLKLPESKNVSAKVQQMTPFFLKKDYPVLSKSKVGDILEVSYLGTGTGGKLILPTPIEPSKEDKPKKDKKDKKDKKGNKGKKGKEPKGDNPKNKKKKKSKK